MALLLAAVPLWNAGPSTKLPAGLAANDETGQA
jgi:hypothetical protein